MQTSLIINKIEKQHAVDKIIVGGVPVWQFLRNIYADELNRVQFHSLVNNKRRDWGYIKSVLSNYFWGRPNRKKHFPAVLFTDTLEERWVNGLKTDKLAHSLLIKMGNKILVVLDPLNNKHSPISDYFHPNYLSIYNFILPAKFRWKKFSCQNLHILEKIEEEIGVQIPYQDRIKQFFCYVEVFHMWIIKTAPNIIFVNCYFSLRHQALIYAAKQNNVVTAEFQHGIISKAQTAYNIGKNIGKHSFPDYLLSFGEMEKGQVSQNFVSCNNIIPIGNYYLEYIMEKKTTPQIEKLFATLRQNYNRIILISSQEEFDEKLMSFLSEAADRLPDVAFLFFPREYKKLLHTIIKPDNLLIQPYFDIYQCCKYCDYHSTVFSTFASESVYMGIPNIFINLNGLSKFYYSAIFSSSMIVKFADEVNSYVKIINEWNQPGIEEVKVAAQLLFRANHPHHIRDFIENKVKV